MNASLRLGLMSVTAFVVGGLLAPAPATAYVRTTTQGGIAMRWDERTITMHLYTDDPPPVLNTELLVRAAERAATAWSHRAIDCSGLDIKLLTVPGVAEADVTDDFVNRITFRRKEWCRKPRSQDEPCYPHSALALTTVFAQKADGKIVDTDIEVNAVDFQWTDVVDSNGQGSGKHDIQNALTHEVGHVIGLDHTCYSGQGKRPQDNRNEPAPLCSESYGNPLIADATMYPAVVPGDTKRRLLSTDDRMALCDIYPNSSGDSLGCAVGGRGRRPAGALVTLLALAGLAGRRRRRRA